MTAAIDFAMNFFEIFWIANVIRLSISKIFQYTHSISSNHLQRRIIMKQKFDETQFLIDLMDSPQFIFTSRDLARYFGRPHSIIVRKIEQTIDDILEKKLDLKSTMRFIFCKARFVTRGRKYRIYILTRTSLFFLIPKLKRMKKFHRLWSIYQSMMCETCVKMKLKMKIDDPYFAIVSKDFQRQTRRYM